MNTCPSSTECLNLEGTYRCECNATNEINVRKRSTHSAALSFPATSSSSSCSTSCIVDGLERSDGERWPLSSRQPCVVCECNEGTVECKPKECDCTDPQSDSQCCPNCSRPESVCHHQDNADIIFKNGAKWVYDCQTCQCRVSICR